MPIIHLIIILYITVWFKYLFAALLEPIFINCCNVFSFTLLNMLKHICSYLRRSLEWQTPKVVGFELFSSLVMAFISWQLFSACQRPM
jgi:hypothetical protein